MDMQSEAGVLVLHDFPGLPIDSWSFTMDMRQGKVWAKLELVVGSTLSGDERRLLVASDSGQQVRARISGVEYALICTERAVDFNSSWATVTTNLLFHAVPLRYPKLHPVTIMRRKRGLR
jgi:hypothetical protein